MQDIRETKAVKEVLALAEILLCVDNAIGELTGPAGTGKSVAGRAVVHKLKALRVVGFEGMTRRQMLLALASQLGIEGVGSAERVLQRRAHDARVLLVVDEANKLSWRVLETLRFLADECQIALLLIGTELYSRKFLDARTKPLLVQLGSRIGAKRVATRHLDRAEVYAHVIRPWFGDVTDKDVVTTFWVSCHKGNFREAIELAGECKRIMAANGIQSVTPAVLELATKWMANRYEAGG